MRKIPEGCILLARKIQKSEIWNKPSWWYKVWSFILMEVNHTGNEKFTRGTNFFTYEDIYYKCHLSKEGIRRKSVENAIDGLRKTTQITTRKTTRGIVITVTNYNQYQNLINYKYDTENDTEKGILTPQKRHYKQECKECKETTIEPEKSAGDDSSSNDTATASLTAERYPEDNSIINGRDVPIPRSSAGPPSPLFLIVELFKKVKGYTTEDVDEDSNKRYFRAAKLLYKAMGGNVDECLNLIDWMSRQKYSWELETCRTKIPAFRQSRRPEVQQW